MEVVRLEEVAVPVNLFQCPVHLDLPSTDSKIYQCNNGHIICEACYSQLPLFPQCPTCREIIMEPIRNRVLEEALKYLEKPCPFESRGCTFRSQRSDLSKHIVNCLFGPVHVCKILGFLDCPFDAFNPTELLHHLRIDCRHKFPCNRNEYISYNYNFAGNNANSVESTAVSQTMKTLICARFRLTPEEWRPFFVYLTKEDVISNEFCFICLYIGPYEPDLETFQVMFRFATGEITKCTVLWHATWYKETINGVTGDYDIWKDALRLSKNMLRLIQGNSATTSVYVRVKETSDSTWLPYKVEWHSNKMK